MRLEPTIALERKLGLLSSEFSKEELIRAYAQEILDASDLQRQINAEIGPAVEVLPGLVGMLEQGAREWLDYAKNVEVAVAAQKKANETLPTARGFRSRGVPGVGQGRNTIFDPILGPLPKAPVEEQLRAINKRVKTIDRLNSSAIPATAKLQKLKDAAKLLESEIPLLTFEIDDLRSKGLKDKEIMELLGDRIGKVGDAANFLSLEDIPENIKALIKWGNSRSPRRITK